MKNLGVSMYKSFTIASADVDLVTRLGIAFATRPRISWHDIQASVRDGVVTLRGEVPTIYDRQLIIAVTRHVAGVLNVDDQLSIADVESRKSDSTGSFNAPRQADRKSSHDLRRIRSRDGRHYLCACVAVFALATLMITGCGGDEAGRVPVHPLVGSIQFRGQPAAGAFVSLHPKSGSPIAPNPSATVGPDGKFAFTTYDGQDGAPEGDYVLTVQWYKPIRHGNDVVGGPNVLPAKYAKPRTSDVHIKVAAGENRLQPIQLR
jgi:hypothetical protein